jgi:hypothetical protein
MAQLLVAEFRLTHIPSQWRFGLREKSGWKTNREVK